MSFNKAMMRCVFQCLCFFVVLLFLFGCSHEVNRQNVKLVLALDYTPNTNHTGIYLSKDLGYYAAEGIDLSIIQPFDGGALALLASGAVDFAISFEEELLVAANAVNPVSVSAVAAIVEHNISGIISLKSAQINRFKELENKFFKSLDAPVYDKIVKRCVTLDGGDAEKVCFIPNSVVDCVAGLSKNFDAAWVYESWDKIAADLKGIDTNFIKFSEIDTVFDYYTPVIVTTRSTLTERREILERFLTATEKGYEYAKTHPEDAAVILSKYIAEVDTNLIYCSQKFLSPQYYTSKWGVIDETRWDAFFYWLKAEGILNSEATEKALTNILQ